jgi:hypothetical protein
MEKVLLTIGYPKLKFSQIGFLKYADTILY